MDCSSVTSSIQLGPSYEMAIGSEDGVSAVDADFLAGVEGLAWVDHLRLLRVAALAGITLSVEQISLSCLASSRGVRRRNHRSVLQGLAVQWSAAPSPTQPKHIPGAVT